MEKLGQNNIYSQYLGQYPIVRTYKGTDLINEYKPLYNPPSDWSDIRTDCPENSIALYAGHTVDYSSYDNLGFTATMSATDLTTIGSPTIVDGIASGFTTSDYLQAATHTDPITIGTKVETKCKFTTGTIGEQGIIGTAAQYGANGFGIISSGKLEYRIYALETEDLSSKAFNTRSNITLEANTTYEAYSVIEGRNITLNIYNGSGTLLDTATLQIDDGYTRLYNYYQFRIGRTQNGAFTGAIDLNNTYIKFNDVYYLLPYSSSNGYKVYIDGTQYGTTYNSDAQCSITWSTSGITTGDDITTPEALKAHKIWIEPATAGNNITAFQCKRVAASGREEQGVLWTHFNLTNAIKIIYAFCSETTHKNALLEVVTAKNNLITYNVSSGVQSGFYSAFGDSTSLEYLPVLKAENQTYPSGTYIAFRGVPVKKVVIKNNNGGETFSMLNQTNVEEFVVENGLTLGSATSNLGDAHGATKLKKFPKINQNKGENFRMYNCPALEPVNIDDRFNDIRKVFRFYGTQSIPTPALKSLRVSNEAPFDGADPQINVNYTGMDRTALVQLFNDLPYNVGYTIHGSPTIEDGIYNGGGTYTNYLEFSQTLRFYTNDFEIQTELTPSSISSGMRIIATDGGSTSYSGLHFTTSGNHFRFIIYNGTEQKIVTSSLAISANKTYSIKAFRNGTTLGISAAELGNDYTTDTITLENSDSQISGTWHIGAGSQSFFNGTINLNNTYIKINDVYYFRGQPAMTKTLSCVGATGNQDKLTIVGNPTIENSVMSGFSSSNYAQTSNSIDINYNIVSGFEAQTRIKVPSYNSGLAVHYFTGSGGISSGLSINSTGKVYWLIGRDDTSGTNISIGGGNTTTIPLDTFYYIRLNILNNIATLYTSIDGILWNTESTLDMTGMVIKTYYNRPFGFGHAGISTNNNYIFNGSIDLNETYIKVNNTLWFGREQYLLQEDKAIALNKGWALTLVAS